MPATRQHIVLDVGPWGLSWYTSGRLRVYRHAACGAVLWKQVYAAEEGLHLWN